MENLAPLIFFAIIGLIQLLVRWVRTMQQQQQQQQQERQQPPAPIPEEPELSLPPLERPPVARVPVPARVLIGNRVPDDEELMVRTPAPPARPATAAPPRRALQRGLHPRLCSRADMRRAVVLMEILGPPRAAVDAEARGGR